MFGSVAGVLAHTKAPPKGRGMYRPQVLVYFGLPC